MKKKKSPTQSIKSSNRKPRILIKRRHKDDFEIEDVALSHDEHDHFSYNENDIDEFEHLQELSETPGTLHASEDHEDDQELEGVEDDDLEDPPTKTKEPDQQSLTARGNKNKHYVKPEEFEYLIKEYYKNEELTNELCECVFKIANRLSYRPNFVNYTFREEMVGDAIERMVFALSNKIYKYNPRKIGKNGKKGNAFLYFTKIAENAFINRIKIESRNREAISNYQEDVYHNLIQKGIDIGDKSTMYSE